MTISLEVLTLERRHIEKLMQAQNTNNDMEIPKKPKQVNNIQKKNNNFNETENKFNNNCLVHPNQSHFTRKCRAFRSMPLKQRAEIVSDVNGCELCLSKSHCNEPCPWINKWGKCGIDGCDKFHSHLLHNYEKSKLSMCINNPGNIIEDKEFQNVFLLIKCPK